MTALGCIVSYYLTDSSHRATVLSFKGVAINLGYGFISLLFALALRSARHGIGADPDAAVAHGLTYLPFWILLGAVVCLVCFAKHRRLLATIPKTDATE